MWNKLRVSILTLYFLLIFVLPIATAEENERLTFGMSAVFSGPVKQLGLSMREGIQTYFKKINAEGGVNGKKLELKSIDDSYEPEFASSNVYRMINSDGINAFIGNVGTPTAKASVPILVENETLLFAPFTGSSILRPFENKDYLIKTPGSGEYLKNKYIINFRPSYAQETEKIIDNLLASGIKPYEIAIFTQDDSYGFDGYKGAVNALEKRGYSYSHKIPYGTYKRNTLDIEKGLLDILNSRREIKAVILVGSYKPVAKFIQFAEKLIPNAVYINVSFVGCLALAELLGEDNENTFVTGVVPNFNSDLDIVRSYREDLKKYFPDSKPNFISLEGYIAAYIFVQGLKNAGGDYSSEGIINGIEEIDFNNLDFGFHLSIDETDHQLSDNVWLSQITGGTCEEITWSGFRDYVQNLENRLTQSR